MIAAIYARKSTDQVVADDQKSVARQVAHAREYADRKGWIVEDAHVFVDDGVSGAEFSKRPGFLRLMNALKPRPPFQVLIMSEESRLGRESIETAYALKQLVAASVRVFFYLEDRERTLDSPTDKIMLSLTAFADELEREKARQRTSDAMMRKAKAGHVTGGRVFGYDNVEILGAGGVRSHVERQINETEADVVRRIFQLSADGRGLSAIAKTLNEARAVAPRAQQQRPTGWAPSSVREILHRTLYRGVITWNKSKKRDQWGQSRQKARPEAEWLSIDAPQLRIVPEALWDAAHGRLATQRQVYLRNTGGQLQSRPRDSESAYLLSGFARCGCCNGGLCVRTGSTGSTRGRGRAYFYACTAHHKRGRAICANNLEIPMEPLNAAIVRALEHYVLNPAVLARVADEAIAAMSTTEKATSDLEGVRHEVRTLNAEIGRLTEAIASGGELTGLMKALQAREARRAELIGTISASTMATFKAPTQAVIRRRIDEKLADWQGLLDRHVAQSRQILRKLLEGPIVCTPMTAQKGVTFRAAVSVGPLISGVLNDQRIWRPHGPIPPLDWPWVGG